MEKINSFVKSTALNLASVADYGLNPLGKTCAQQSAAVGRIWVLLILYYDHIIGSSVL